jgi:signal transduction histidine kinase
MNAGKPFEILDSFVDSIAIVSLKGKIIFTNKAWKNFSNENEGNEEHTGCGINYLSLCRQVKGKEQADAISAADGLENVIGRKKQFFELEYACHSLLVQRWFIMRVCPLVTDSQLTMVSHINVTKRKMEEGKVEERNDQLKVVNERLNSTMFKIVHDIQSPLSSIEGLMALTKREEKSNSIGQYFSLIEKSVSNLKAYVSNTAKLVSFDALIGPVVFETVVDEFLESIKYNDALKIVRIEKTVKQTCEYFSSKADISSIIVNLLHNSLKYYDIEKPRSTIALSIVVDEIEATIAVKDNGIGIEEKALGRIFDLNFQVKKNNSKGAGIGLYLVKKSVEYLNGKLSVNSKPGEGTEFVIVLPNKAKQLPNT